MPEMFSPELEIAVGLCPEIKINSRSKQKSYAARKAIELIPKYINPGKTKGVVL